MGDSFSDIYPLLILFIKPPTSLIRGKVPWGRGCYIKNVPTAHD